MVVKLGVWRCTFDAAGTTHAGVLVCKDLEPVRLLLCDRFFTADELSEQHPGRSELRVFEAKRGLVDVDVTESQWMASTEAEKAAIVHGVLVRREMRS